MVDSIWKKCFNNAPHIESATFNFKILNSDFLSATQKYFCD